MKKVIRFSKIVFLGFAFFYFFNTANASLNIDTSVDVPASCTATDKTGVAYNYPQDNSYLAICALEAALSNGSVSSVQLKNYPGLGLLLEEINNVGDPNSQYWALYQNGVYASFGITSLSITTGDTIMFQLHDDISDSNLGDQVTLHIHSLRASLATAASGEGPLVTSPIIPKETSDPAVKHVFDPKKALQFLIAQQKNDGSFGENLYTDWAAIALGAVNTNESYSVRSSILAYFNSHNAISPLLTDNERHVMALLSLHQNPYSFNGANYIKAITDSFDGTQFGDTNLVNDDIFALIPLKNSGYTANDDMIVKDIAFLISKQKTDGSWEENTDITAAAISALKSFETTAGASESLSKATDYLTNAQGNDGGWDNVSSTSWAMQAMSALSLSWIKNGKTPIDYLGVAQTNDGAVLPLSETPENRIWATSYALAGASLMPWSSIMQNVPKPTDAPKILKQDVNAIALNTPAKKTGESPVKKISIALAVNKTKIAEIPAKNISAEKLNPNTLTATATNAGGTGNVLQNLPIILGTASGLVLFYLALKFLII